MTNFLKGLAKLPNFWPNVDYMSFVPATAASSEAWEQIGKNISKALLVELLTVNASEAELKKIDAAIIEFQERYADKYVADSSSRVLFHGEKLKSQQKEARTAK